MASETVRAGCQLPEDLVSILDSLGKAETDARQVVESLTDTQLTWQASVGKTWSIAQCFLGGSVYCGHRIVDHRCTRAPPLVASETSTLFDRNTCNIAGGHRGWGEFCVK